MGERRIGIILMMRLGSERLPRKLLQDVAGRPLFSYVAATAIEASRQPSVSAFACVPIGDWELIQAVENMGLEVVLRSESSGAGETADTIYDAPFRDAVAERCDYAVSANPCMPFLSAATLLGAVDKARTAERSFVSCRSMRGFVWDECGEMVVGTPGMSANTKTNPIFRVNAHALYGFWVGAFGTPAMYKFADFFDVPDTAEFLDVDTPEDLELVRAWAEHTAPDPISAGYPYPHPASHVVERP